MHDGTDQKSGFACQVCKFEERGRRLKNMVICTKHCLRLCARSYELKQILKVDGEEISDYSWMAPDDTMSCWEKAHHFYIPKGLFKGSGTEKNQEWNSTTKLKFVNAAVSSECYMAKRRALGLTHMKCGRSSPNKKGRSKPGNFQRVDTKDSDSEYESAAEY
jgi:hypothetical protein